MTSNHNKISSLKSMLFGKPYYSISLLSYWLYLEPLLVSKSLVFSNQAKLIETIGNPKFGAAENPFLVPLLAKRVDYIYQLLVQSITHN